MVIPHLPQVFFRNPHVGVQYFKEKGRGLVAIADIAKGALIDEAPILRVSQADRQYIPHILNEHLFAWEPEGEEAGFAIGFGLITLVNHSAVAANCELKCHHEKLSITLTATDDILKGQEILYDYDCDLLFSPIER